MTDVATTHAEGCWAWGPKHYSCAVREIERLRARVAEMEHVSTDLHLVALSIATSNALPDILAELHTLRARVAELERDLDACRVDHAEAYEQGRRDALRGVQAAALYRHAELWQGRVRLTSADERRDIEACELAWAAAQAAEEAARALERGEGAER